VLGLIGDLLVELAREEDDDSQSKEEQCGRED
jgi:hypothetical protein